MAAIQVTGADKGVASAQVVAVGAGATAVDATAFANLAEVTQLEVRTRMGGPLRIANA